MLNTSILTLFIPTFCMVSLTPGMCMTLSLTLGMTLGLRRTFWMMWGELVGVALVAVSAVIGAATIMFDHPTIFSVLKWGGGAYLLWLGFQLCRSRGRMAIPDTLHGAQQLSRINLITQGFVTAIANPKGWAFFIALLPPFIAPDQPLLPQTVTLVAIILVIEFCCLVLYASGGKQLRRFLEKKGGGTLLNRISGLLLMAVGLWLAFG